MKSKNLLESFKYALQGIKVELKGERNLKIHIIMMILVIIAGLILKISIAEWGICIILFGLVISAELFNTAIETTVDIAMPERNEKAKKAKDVSAGAVFIISLASAIIGLIIFIPKIINLINSVK